MMCFRPFDITLTLRVSSVIALETPDPDLDFMISPCDSHGALGSSDHFLLTVHMEGKMKGREAKT